MTKRTGEGQMKSNRGTQGFTLLEMLGAVAILVVLAALVFVGVIQYQRSIKRVEMDGVAK